MSYQSNHKTLKLDKIQGFSLFYQVICGEFPHVIEWQLANSEILPVSYQNAAVFLENHRDFTI